MTTLTSGPETAISNSWSGLVGLRSRKAMPPNGNKVIERTGM